MRVYLDKNFARNYWNIKKDERGVLDHFTKTILHQTAHYTLVTNYTSFEEIQESEEDELIFEMIFEGVPKLYFENFVVNDEFVKHCASKGGIILFLTEQNIEQESDWTQKYGYEFLSNNSLINKWEKYFNNMEMKRSLSLLPNPKDEFAFNGWHHLSFINQTPYKSLIIVDKYVLSSESLIKNNLIPLIDHILPINGIKEFNILIIAEKILDMKSKSPEEAAKKVHALINTLLAKHKSIRFRISIMVHNKSFYPAKDAQELHDRIIYTNYYTIEGPSGFEVYKFNKRVISNSKIEANSNFNKFQMNVIPAQLLALQNYVKKVIRTDSINFKYFPENIKSALIQI